MVEGTALEMRQGGNLLVSSNLTSSAMQPVYTIGHSTRELKDFFAALKAHGIEFVADVRSSPGSRRYPHFNTEALAASLPAHGIGYVWIPALGGRRKTLPHSPNLGWRNASFRGYADYMQTPQFAEGLEQLEKLAREKSAAIMCSEAVPWRCHRSLIADALIARGWRVFDIFDASAVKIHLLNPMARIVKGAVSYPPEQEPLV